MRKLKLVKSTLARNRMLTFIIIHIMLNIVIGQSTVNILRILFVLKKQNSEFNLFLQEKEIIFLPV